MKKNVIILVFFIFSFCSLFAQKHELGKVTVEELKEKSNPADTSAVASYIFQVGKSSIEYSTNEGFVLITQIDSKIKIYNKEGYDFANKTISFYKSENASESVSVSKAFTYALSGDKIEKTKLGSEGEFVVKKNKYYSQKKITMPNIKEGVIIEFRITIKSPFLSKIPEWYFQKNIPVSYSEFTTNIPEYYLYNVRTKGYIFPKVTTNNQSKTISFSGFDHVSTTIGTERAKYYQENINYIENRTTYIAENLPAMKDESFVNNIDNYRSAVQLELSSKKLPNSKFENFASDWEGVVKKIYDNESFGEELIKTNYFEKDVDALLAGVSSEEEKINILFKYVKTRMNSNDYFTYYCDEGVKSAYQNKIGNVAEINLMLTSMLRYVGIQANPVLVSTRSNGITFFPSRTAFDYVIAAVEINEGLILLDASNKNTLPNILPVEALNWFGRIIRKDGTSAEVNLMTKIISKEVVNLIASIDSKGNVSGKIRGQYFDYNAFEFREENIASTKEKYLEKLEKQYSGIEISEYDVQNEKDLSKPIVENFTFTHSNSVEIIGDKMYFSPLVFLAEKKNPFTQEVREYPIDFVYPHQDKITISLTIPDGYVVESLPKSKAGAMPEDLASFRYTISNTGTQIQLVYTQNVNQAILAPDYYDILRNFTKDKVEIQNEKIILKKL